MGYVEPVRQQKHVGDTWEFKLTKDGCRTCVITMNAECPIGWERVQQVKCCILAVCLMSCTLHLLSVVKITFVQEANSGWAFFLAFSFCFFATLGPRTFSSSISSESVGSSDGTAGSSFSPLISPTSCSYSSSTLDISSSVRLEARIWEISCKGNSIESRSYASTKTCWYSAASCVSSIIFCASSTENA